MPSKNETALSVFDTDGQYPIRVELKRVLWNNRSFDLTEFVIDENGLVFDYPDFGGHMTRVWVPLDQIAMILQKHDDPEPEDDEDDESTEDDSED